MQADTRNRSITFVVVIIAAILFLLPTFFREELGKSWISKPLSLGLDLKGGVHLVYQVESAEAVKSRLQSAVQAARNEMRKEKIAVTRSQVGDDGKVEITLLNSRNLDKAKEKIESVFRRDLTYIETQSGENERVKLIYQTSPDFSARVEKEAVQQAVETLRNRVDQFGVAEPLIQQVGADRIMLQMPGVTDIESVKKIVGRVAKLEFRLVPARPGAENTIKLKDQHGAAVEVEDQALMTGDAVDYARPGTQDGQVEVLLTLTSEGTRLFRQITSDNVGRQLAIILDSIVYSSPVIREAIPGGSASISGGFTLPEASQLALVLRSGALPAPLTVMEERTVGPTLGQESIEKGISAMIFGIALIFVFMVFYYKKSGLIAVSSLCLNLFFLMAALSAFGATLTLPGLAGLALTAGMAVDSNVLIFERIRDELRIGATRDAAVSAGFEKAYTAIFDANVTTLLSAVILYALGSGPIRGFAVTLSIGVLTTLYCAVSVARLAFDYFPLASSKKALSI